MHPRIDQSCRRLAARYIRRQIKQLTSQLEGVRSAADTEPLHRARVATRRLRQALIVMEDCFAKESLAFWRKEIRRLGRGLGKARDKDVQVQWLADVFERLDDRRCVLGVAAILVRCQRKRDRLQPKVLRLFRQTLAGRALAELRAAAKKMAAEAGAVGENQSTAFDRARRHIAEQAQSLRSFEPCLARPGDADQHHAMRIAAKRLRYAMELFRPLYQGRLDRVIEAVKQIQSLLGDVHDNDVWKVQLDKMIEKESKRLIRLYRHGGSLAAMQPGLEFLKKECRRRREFAFATLQQFWCEQTEAGLWEELSRIIEQKEMPAAEAAQAEAAPAGQHTAAAVRQSAKPEKDGNGSPSSRRECLKLAEDFAVGRG